MIKKLPIIIGGFISMFLFKKIVSYFLFPLSLSSIFLLAGLIMIWTKKKHISGKLLLSFGILSLLLFSNGVVASMLLHPLEYRYASFSETPPVAATDKLIKWVVVLAHGHSYAKGIPASSMLTGETLFCLVEGIRLYRENPRAKLLLSGGAVFDVVSQAEVMAEVAKSLGVPSEDIVLEASSIDTEEQAKIVKRMVSDDRFILVALAVHMPRSMALFKKNGMHPLPAPSGHRSTTGANKSIKVRGFLPNMEALRGCTMAFYEYLGLAWAKLTGKI